MVSRECDAATSFVQMVDSIAAPGFRFPAPFGTLPALQCPSGRQATNFNMKETQMSASKKSLVSSLKTSKKAKVASTSSVKGAKNTSLRMLDGVRQVNMKRK